ncbi:hypothetical protein CCZ01_07575 [Helicobacter monodelphidis]|uniref:hypothetical protein n=1 Tax=Helicobacter sp. 15-1451 TaxID=2004995 RepID=UPI000DCE7FDA|nr:hypothetical protein [Helicobacter sp. 15-1451]RAX57018.1 hypothetical protein CCZ01_07575 [Helicobacter sp. 15-1451]
MEEKNTFIIKLEQESQKLIQCQEEHALKSCLSCMQLLECSVRQNYIRAVYGSMSQGNNADFDF